MKREVTTTRALMAVLCAVVLSLPAGPVVAAEGVNPDADEILRSMSSFLGGLKSFSLSADISNEIITQDGQKLQLNSDASVLLERPSHLHMTRHGKVADAALFYDGTMLTFYSSSLNAYVQEAVAGTTDDALAAIERDTGFSMPGADLLLTAPYAVLAPGVTSSGYYGRAYVGGVECHHLAFRTARVDWQLWVKAGDEPLPMKYVITTKWMTGAPQFSVQFSNWTIKPAVAAGAFAFRAPKGAKQLQQLPIDESGELGARREDER